LEEDDELEQPSIPITLRRQGSLPVPALNETALNSSVLAVVRRARLLLKLEPATRQIPVTELMPSTSEQRKVFSDEVLKFIKYGPDPDKVMSNMERLRAASTFRIAGITASSQLLNRGGGGNHTKQQQQIDVIFQDRRLLTGVGDAMRLVAKSEESGRVHLATGLSGAPHECQKELKQKWIQMSKVLVSSCFRWLSQCADCAESRSAFISAISTFSLDFADQDVLLVHESNIVDLLQASAISPCCNQIRKASLKVAELIMLKCCSRSSSATSHSSSSTSAVQDELFFNLLKIITAQLAFAAHENQVLPLASLVGTTEGTFRDAKQVWLIDDQAVIIGDPMESGFRTPSLELSRSHTFSMWVWLSKDSSGTLMTKASEEKKSSILLAWSEIALAVEESFLVLRLSDGMTEGRDFVLTSTTKMKPHRWTHVAYTADINNSKMLSLFVDGKLVCEKELGKLLLDGDAAVTEKEIIIESDHDYANNTDKVNSKLEILTQHMSGFFSLNNTLTLPSHHFLFLVLCLFISTLP